MSTLDLPPGETRPPASADELAMWLHRQKWTAIVQALLPILRASPRGRFVLSKLEQLEGRKPRLFPLPPLGGGPPPSGSPAAMPRAA